MRLTVALVPQSLNHYLVNNLTAAVKKEKKKPCLEGGWGFFELVAFLNLTHCSESNNDD